MCVGGNGATRLTFSPAAEVYSPRRTSITAGSREPSSGNRPRPKPLSLGIISAVTSGRFVWYPCVFPIVTHHTFDCCSFDTKKKNTLPI